MGKKVLKHHPNI